MVPQEEERAAKDALATALAEEREVALTSASMDELFQQPDGSIKRFHVFGGAAAYVAALDMQQWMQTNNRGKTKHELQRTVKWG
jgi:hypothetical protein